MRQLPQPLFSQTGPTPEDNQSRHNQSQHKNFSPVAPSPSAITLRLLFAPWLTVTETPNQKFLYYNYVYSCRTSLGPVKYLCPPRSQNEVSHPRYHPSRLRVLRHRLRPNTSNSACSPGSSQTGRFDRRPSQLASCQSRGCQLSGGHHRLRLQSDLCRKGQQRDWDRFRSLFIPDAALSPPYPRRRPPGRRGTPMPSFLASRGTFNAVTVA